jgi:hypothetical protein
MDLRIPAVGQVLFNRFPDEIAAGVVLFHFRLLLLLQDHSIRQDAQILLYKKHKG